jgi:UDP-N-acetylmuramate dehydrogenase
MGWNQTLRGALTDTFGGKILFDEPAAAYTSLRVGGKMDALVFPENSEELSSVIGFTHRHAMPFVPVGNWTNLIVRDGGFRGIVISLSRLQKLLVRHQADGTALITAEAGCPLAQMVKTAAKESLSGSEFCTGIPGSVGGAIRMNAGAYGGEIKDIVEDITIIDKNGKTMAVAQKELNFTYRNLDLPADSIIITGTFQLHSGRKKEIAAKMAEIIRKRKDKHPLDLPNAGSIFRNPPDCPAGRLIEESGLKGLRVGDAQISEKHANFIVNRGTASATDIMKLMDFIVQSVFEKTGRTLESEVRVVGES